MYIRSKASSAWGTGTVYRSRAPKCTLVFSGLCATQSLVFCVVLCRPLHIFLSFFLANVLSLILRFTSSLYPFWYLQTFVLHVLELMNCGIFGKNTSVIFIDLFIHFQMVVSIILIQASPLTLGHGNMP